MIPNYTIYADKVQLTANYYVEYLGFNMLYKVEEEENPYAWLELNGQFLLIWPWSNKLGLAKPICFEVDNIQDYYTSIFEKSRVESFLTIDKNRIARFSILDCEGNSIMFSQQTSKNINSTENELNVQVSSKI